MLRFLVVDDDYHNRVLCKRAIETYLGVEVRTAESVEEALNIFQNEKFDLVLTDKDMGIGAMNGIELSLRIKEIEPLIPIVLMSGKPPAVKPASVDRMLQKPFRKSDIVALIELIIIE